MGGMKTRTLKQEYLIYRDELPMHYTTLVSLGRKSSKDLFSQVRKSCQDYLIDKVVTKMTPGQSETALKPNVVARLASRMREARSMGFQVRQEFLGGQPGNWCEIAGTKFVFLDSSQSAIDQLSVLDHAIRSYRPAA